MRFGWIGFHMEGIPALRAVLEAGYPVEAVLTLTPERAAKRSGAVSYQELCAAFGVPLHEIRNVNDPETIALLRSLDLDVVFVIGWTQIVRPEALATARIGMVGAHASLLPHNRGRAPVNWAIIRGERETGNTLMWLSPEVDAGEIIDQVAIPITPYDTCGTIYERVAEANREMILRLIPKLLRGERPGRPQPPSTEPLLPGRRPEDGRIDWSASATTVYDLIRGVTRPYPGAFTHLDGEKLLVWNAALLPGALRTDAPAGTILGPVVSPEPAACGQAVACGSGAVVLLEVEREDGTILRGRELSEQAWSGKRLTHA